MGFIDSGGRLVIAPRFESAGTAMRFDDCYYYWLSTSKGEGAQAGRFIIFLELSRRGSELHNNIYPDAPRRRASSAPQPFGLATTRR